MLPEKLRRFLATYVAVEKDTRTAVRAFVANEEPEEVRQLLHAIREVFQMDPSGRAIDEEIERLGNVRLRAGQTGRDFLVDVFSLVTREAQFSPDVKPYDVFISYSSQDRELAAWLAAELRRTGYAVWLDRDEILVGHNIVDEVYRGILQSRFLIVLLTRNSVRSKWVREELSAGRIEEIENARVTVLPVNCGSGIEIPPPLRSKRFADFTVSREEGLQSLTRAIDLHPAAAPRGGGATLGRPTDLGLSEWYEIVAAETTQLGYNPSQGGYKDVVVGPPDGDDARYEKRQLSSLLDRTRVRIKGWGGAPFPYERHTKARVENMPDGVRLVDTTSWPFSVWNFYCWRITGSLRFFQRSNLLEDGDIAENGQVALRGYLNVIWVIKDVCMALMFARNLLAEVPSLHRLVVIQRLGGMDRRRLIIRGFARAPLYGDYVSNRAVIEGKSIVERGTGLEEEALRLIGEIFWLFNWNDFDPGVIRSDVKEFLAGKFPPNW